MRETPLVKPSLLESVLRRVGPLATDGHTADADLLRRFAADRDEIAFTALVRRHGPLVWAVCRNMLSNEPDAEDAFQATFLALIRSAATVRKPAALGAWLHGVAYRVAMKAKRSAARRRTREQVVASDERSLPVAQATWDQLQIAVHEEVNRLPEPLRTAFVVCGLEGTGQQQAADALGWKLGTLSGRLTRARHLLLDRLAKRGLPAGVVVGGVIAGGAATAEVPMALAARVGELAAMDLIGKVSGTVVELARGATEVFMTRTKIMAVVAALFVAGTVTVLIPLAVGQRPAIDPFAKGADNADYGGQPPTSAASGRTPYVTSTNPTIKWEYKFIPRTTESLEDFQRILTEQGNAGWEYCGVESLKATDQKNRAEWGTNPTIVFKRHRGVVAGGTASTASTGSATSGTWSGTSQNPPKVAKDEPSTNRLPMFGGPALGGSFSTKPAPQNDLRGVENKQKVEMVVISLRNVEAKELAVTLEQLFGEHGGRIVPEARSNAIIVRADAESIKEIIALVEKLDVPGAEPPKRK